MVPGNQAQRGCHLNSDSWGAALLPFNQTAPGRIFSPGEGGPLLHDEIVLFSS